MTNVIYNLSLYSSLFTIITTTVIISNNNVIISENSNFIISYYYMILGILLILNLVSQGIYIRNTNNKWAKLITLGSELLIILANVLAFLFLYYNNIL